MIREKLRPDEIINPSDYGLKSDLKSVIRSSDVVVGMAIENRYTFLVWNELNEAEKHGAEIYTIRVRNKEEIGEIESGRPGFIKELGRKESEVFAKG